MDQFVVLFHKMPNDSHRNDHWDLMLKHDHVLWTWALDELPSQQVHCTGVRLPDHDLKYLQYEGPVSGDRGQVKRVISGQYHWLSTDLKNICAAELLFADQKLRMTIETRSAEHCLFSFE